jgi:hypothetical protein
MKKISIIILVVLGCLTPCLPAADTEEKTPAPGFRPESEYADAFIKSVGTAQVIVYPTVVRIKTPDDIVMSYNSQSQRTILDYLRKQKIADSDGLDLTKIEGQSQYDFFQSSMKLMAEEIKQPYHVAAEIIIIQRPDNRLGIWGIHVYILDPAGNNAFSFLLNSHHQILVDANLFSDTNSKEAVDKLVAESTQVAMQALTQQIEQAR